MCRIVKYGELISVNLNRRISSVQNQNVFFGGVVECYVAEGFIAALMVSVMAYTSLRGRPLSAEARAAESFTDRRSSNR